MSRSQLKLASALAALVLLVVGVSGLLAERSLRSRELDRIARSLQERAALVRELAHDIHLEWPARAQLDALADRVAGTADARVTLIAVDGRVVGDSDVALEALSGVANHGDRPEVQAAFQGQVGASERRSSTIGSSLLYVAVPESGGRGGAVRVAVALSDVDAAVSELRRELVKAGAIGMLAALGLAWGLSWITLRPLEEVRRVAASIAGGDLDGRLPLRAGDELGEIAGAINQLAEQLRLRLEEATREKEQLAAVLDGMVEGVLVIDAKEHVVLANGRLREFFGISGEVQGGAPLEAIRDAELEAILHRASTTDAAVSGDIAVTRPTPRTLRVQAVRFPSGLGERMGTVAVFHDVTELTRLEQVRRDFVANASHELRTPLAAIQGFAETLLSSSAQVPETQRRSYLEIIDRHARRLGHLVRDLLELSRIESRDPYLERAEIDVSAVVEGVLSDWSGRFAEKDLEASRAGEDSATAWVDGRALEQILTNLVENAVKYTEPGGRIEVGLEGKGASLEVWVADSGIGIPPADRDRIFERFYRVDKARSRALGGTGLGLSIVKHLVQSQGGEIRVESELGKGTTFRFSLPRHDWPSPT